MFKASFYHCNLRVRICRRYPRPQPIPQVDGSNTDASLVCVAVVFLDGLEAALVVENVAESVELRKSCKVHVFCYDVLVS